MKILRIESLSYGVDDVEASLRYYEDWGLATTEHGKHGADYLLPSGQQIKVRNADDPTLPAPIEKGSTVREVVWGVEDERSLDEIGAELGKDQDVKRGPDGVRAQDPFGLSVAFRVAQPAGTARASDRVRNHPFDMTSRAQPQRIGHAVFFVPRPKMAAMQQFYLDRLQFRLSDRVPEFGDFMRCSGSLEHHNLFLLQQPERAGFNHAAFEVAHFDEIIVGGKFMLGREWKPATTPGRHVLGSNMFWYFESPCGGNTEYFCDMDLMDDNWKPRVWDKHPGFAYWMMDEASAPGRA
jgi:catechol 2,3-dioxygenase-like lactoylglutathione lyase family enzyme